MLPDFCRRRSTLARVLALIACTSLVPACGPGDGRPPLHPTTGKVAYQGKPVPGAFILLRKSPPDDKVPSPTAITGEDGSFTLTTFEDNDGVPAGDYLVGISTTPRRSESVVGPATKAGPARDVLKGKYADPMTSGLKATIKPGPNTLEPFDLESKGEAASSASPVSRD